MTLRIPSTLALLAACGIAVASVVVTRAQQAPAPETVTLTAALLPSNEVPPVKNPESSGTGTATVVLKTVRDAQKAISSVTADISAELSGFPAGTAVTMAHIHRGAAGSNGAVVVNTGLAAGEVVLTDGSGKFSKTGIAVTPAVAQELLADPAGFYFNVHSTLNPAGVARGALARR